MIKTGDDEKEVRLDEKAVTIRQFKEIIDTREFKTKEKTELLPFDQVLALMRFLDKYDCDHASARFFEILERNVKGDWPSLLLFLCGVHLDRPALCRKALDSPVYNWEQYSEHIRPAGVENESHYCLNPRGIPYHFLLTLPFNYAIALGMTGVMSTVGYSVEGKINLYGSEFVDALQSIREGAAFAKEHGTI